MTRTIATLLAASLTLSAGCSGGSAGTTVAADRSTMFVAAPCPPPDEPDALAGIEGWAPGAGAASKMGSGAQDNMGGFGAAMGGGAAATATPSPAASGGCATFSPFLNDRLAKFAALRKQLPTTSYDVAAAAATFTSPDAAFAFVRDVIKTDAYAGEMRGARGTLASKAGSPADKAALLHDLLAAQSVPSRYVHASLADADAAKIVASATAATPVDPKAIVATQTAKDAIAAGLASARQQAATAAAMLAGKGAALATGDGTAALMANVRDHWWLQAQIGGAWVDLDPTLPGASRGAHLGPAPAGDPVDDLPASIAQTIAVRLIADTGSGKLATLAQARSTTAEAFEAPIVVRMNPAAADDATIRTQTQFVPTVTIGGAGGAGDTFVPDAGGSRLVALYLETESDGPGRMPAIHRQTVVDRRGADGKTIDPAWTQAKTAYALSFTYAGLEATGDGDPVYDASVSIDELLNAALAADFAAAHPGTIAIPPGADFSYPYEAHRFFQYDASVRGAMRAQNPALTWTFDHPSIALLEQSFDLRADGLRVAQTFDIVDNAMTALANGKVASAENLTRGIEDTSVEGSLVSQDGTQIDTGAVFAAAKSAGIATAALPQADGTVRIAPASPVTIDGASAYGYLEVDPASGNAVGRMASGAGQAMTERSILEKAVERYSDIKGIGRCINCFFSGMASALEGDRQHGNKFGQCLADALCQWVVDRTFDWLLVHGFDWEGTGMNLVSGPYSDIAGEVLRGGPTGAICNGVGTKNPYSRPIIG